MVACPTTGPSPRDLCPPCEANFLRSFRDAISMVRKKGPHACMIRLLRQCLLEMRRPESCGVWYEYPAAVTMQKDEETSGIPSRRPTQNEVAAAECPPSSLFIELIS